MSNFKQLLISGLLTLIAFNAQALPITGSMEMGGSFYAIDSEGHRTSNAGEAVEIDFYYFGADMFIVNTATDDFDGLAGSLGYIQDLSFEPFVAPVVDFWAIDVFSFELTDVVRGFTNDPDTVLVLSGVGFITASVAGLDRTAATWSFSGDTTGTGVFSWSATSEVSVPEPGVLFLLAIGLIGIGFVKNVRNNLN